MSSRRLRGHSRDWVVCTIGTIGLPDPISGRITPSLYLGCCQQRVRVPCGRLPVKFACGTQMLARRINEI